MENQEQDIQNKYDYVVIGTGPAGFVSSIKAAQLGLKTAVVQNGVDMLGGACLHEGVIPAKSLIQSAHVLSEIQKNPALYGYPNGNVKADLVAMIEKSDGTISQMKKGLAGMFKKNGIDIINGHSRFLDRNTISVTDNEGQTSNVRSDKFLVATGSVPKPLRGIPFDGTRIISSTEALRLANIPGKIAIVGGGAIGTEFASFFNILGAEVTIIEFEDSLLPSEDDDISSALQQSFKKRGITFHTSSRVSNIAATSDKAIVTIQTGEDETVEEYDVVVISTGRIPLSDSTDLVNAGVEINEYGFIPVDSEMRTNIDNIYAAGDVIPTPMLANVAFAEGEIAAMSAAGQAVEPIDYTLVPNVVYTDVQVASIGITEPQAISQNIDYTTGKQPLVGTFKAGINVERTGFIKVIADTGTGKLLGAHIFAPEASEMIQGYVIAMKAGLTVQEITKVIPPNPTFSESMIDAAKSVFGRTVRS